MLSQEVYKNTSQTVRHRIVDDGNVEEADGQVLVDVYDETADPPELLVEDGLAQEETDEEDNFIGYRFTVGLDLTGSVRTLRIVWKYDYDTVPVESESILEIVTPYVSLSRIRNEFDHLADKGDSELRRVERIVRYVINTYCNQKFMFEEDKTIRVRGSGTDILPLAYRIVDLTTFVRGEADLTEYVEKQDEWSLVRKRRDFNNVKRLVPHLDQGAFFRHFALYDITGDFGWRYVPSEITEAALILVDEHFGTDTKYREKNVSVIRAADWRMEFIKTGDDTTGNANADAMLNQYVNPNWVVVI